MNELAFEDLQRLWQATPPAMVTAQDIILRQRRRRWLSRIYLGMEVVATVVAIPFAIWIGLEQGLRFGLGMLLVVFLAAGASLWARSAQRTRVEDPLLASIEQGLQHARVGVRLGYASLWGTALAMVVVGGFAFLRLSSPDLSIAAARGIILTLAVGLASAAVLIGGTGVYLWARSRELAQMVVVRDALRRQ